MNIIYMPGWRDEDLEMVRNLASAGDLRYHEIER
jgi:hypothetical protein